MLRFLSDENFNGDITRGLLFHLPQLDLIRVQDVGLRKALDPSVLSWAADNDRIVLSHDRTTLPDFAYERIVGVYPCLVYSLLTTGYPSAAQ